MFFGILILRVLLLTAVAQSTSDVQTNHITAVHAPAWLKERRVEKLTDAVSHLLEWDVRRVFMSFYINVTDFQKINTLISSSVVAFTKAQDQSIHMGPTVDDKNFDGVFTHELTHVIIFQKYKQAIPPWLQEGLANFISQKVAQQMSFKGRGSVDYSWLAAQAPAPVEQLSHPLTDRVRYRYEASTALMQMLSARCDVFDLLQLSVGKSLTTYIRNTCGIEDLNEALKTWVKKKAGL